MRKIFLKTKSVDYVEERLFNEKTDAISITNQLIKDGISKSLNFKEAFIEEIIKEISDKKNLKYNNINFLNLNELMNFAEKENISRLVIPLDLNQNLKINNLINSNFFKTVVENYLNKKEVSINCSLFISLAKKNITEREKISAAQMFHFDNDFSKFLKMYIYLTDVSPNHGPHVYVEKTHIVRDKKHDLPKGFSDKQILESYKNVRTIIGKKGTLFLEDSFGFHKANTPLEGYRIILNIHFGNSKIKYSKHDKFEKFE